MTSSVPPRVERAYGILYLISSDILERDGHVALGDLFTSIRIGKGRYEGIPRECTEAVSGLTPVEIQGVYELVLLRLERECGPMECEDPEEATDVIWGYAMPSDVASRDALLSDRSAMIRRRMEALDNGHPDRYRDFDSGSLPTTIWRRSATEGATQEPWQFVLLEDGRPLIASVLRAS